MNACDLPDVLKSQLVPFLTLGQDGQAADGSGGSAGMTLLNQIQNGGITGYIILGLSLAAFSLIIIHLIKIRLPRFIPELVRAQLTAAIAGHDLDAALTICREPDNDCFLTRVVERGLLRYRRSAFGPFEFKDALEEAGGEQVARFYRSTDTLGLIGAIAPMLGLLGTVIGMVGAFDTIAAADSRGELLAGDISKALVTTLMGLSLAIPCMAAFTFFRNRIDTYASIAAHEIEEMTLPLEPASTNGGPGITAAPGPAGRTALGGQNQPRPPAQPQQAKIPSNPTPPAQNAVGQTEAR